MSDGCLFVISLHFSIYFIVFFLFEGRKICTNVRSTIYTINILVFDGSFKVMEVLFRDERHRIYNLEKLVWLQYILKCVQQKNPI